MTGARNLSAFHDGLEDSKLRQSFLKWQCLARQMAMRENQGRPDAAIAPDVFLPGEPGAAGRIITVLNKTPASSMTPELLHMARKTNDPSQMRSEAIAFFSATYFQNHRSFSDLMTAVFLPGSPGAAKIRAAKTCDLVFEAHARRFTLSCRVWKLARANPYFAATLASSIISFVLA